MEWTLVEKDDCDMMENKSDSGADPVEQDDLIKANCILEECISCPKDKKENDKNECVNEDKDKQKSGVQHKKALMDIEIPNSVILQLIDGMIALSVNGFRIGLITGGQGNIVMFASSICLMFGRRYVIYKLQKFAIDRLKRAFY